ncbi:MAG: U32 family peptidase, partial [Bacilli bacterium]
MIELLSPAGDKERLKWALIYGADAVYLGGYKYSLRANATNFSIEDIKQSVLFAHSIHKKIYITVNILMHEKDTEELDQYLIELNEAKVDAIIVSDYAVISAVKRLELDLEIHLSTQESTTNFKTAQFYKDLGVNRIVLARECTLKDILDIKKNTDIELEVFIHGAMCTSYSGKCVLSNYITKRDSNRGGCAQVCRFNFDIKENQPFSIASKDLCMADSLRELISSNVDSLKIEGRMRSIYYIATVVDAYRHLIDKISSSSLDDATLEYYTKVLFRVANRESTHQFFMGDIGVKDQYYTGREEISNQDFLGIVLSYNEQTNIALIEQRNYFEVGDKIEIFGPNMDAKELVVHTILDQMNNSVEAARHPREVIKLIIPFVVK